MKAILLAAGMGKRLCQDTDRPKCLLSFDHKTLLQRHIEILRHHRIDEITVVIGWQGDAIRHHLDQWIEAERKTAPPRAIQPRIRTLYNPDYHQGSLVSLLCAGDAIDAMDKPFLLMDADVLYDWRMLDHLIHAPYDNAILMDGTRDLDDEAVKICLDADDNGWKITDFHKKPIAPTPDKMGESVGFFKLDPACGGFLVRRGRDYLAQGKNHLWYEEVIRDAIVTRPEFRFGVADIGTLPWIEIDTPADLDRARRDIAPGLCDAVPRAASSTDHPIGDPTGNHTGDSTGDHTGNSKNDSTGATTEPKAKTP